jgi:uncharacterized protein
MSISATIAFLRTLFPEWNARSTLVCGVMAAVLAATSVGWYALDLHHQRWVVHPFDERMVLRGTWLQPLVMVALAVFFFEVVRRVKGLRWRDMSRDGRVVAISSLAIIAVLWWFGRGGFYARNINAHIPGSALSPLYSFFYFSMSCVLLRLGIPLLLMRSGLKGRPKDFGWSLHGGGLWKVYLVLALSVCGLVVIFASNQPAFLAKYPMCRAMITGKQVLLWHFLLYQLAYLMVFVSGESFWRGYIAFGLEKDLGHLALVFMIIPYVTAHFGKPLPETLGAIVTGLVLGGLALKHRSFWLGVAAHYGVALTMDLSAIARQGIRLI